MERLQQQMKFILEVDKVKHTSDISGRREP